MCTLIPASLQEKIPDLYETEKTPNPTCIVKLFTPDSNFTWYIIELSKEDKDTCYGYLKGFDNELGYFSLKKLKAIRGGLGLSVERDLSFKPTPLAEIKAMKY